MLPDDESVEPDDVVYRWLPNAMDPAMFVYDEQSGRVSHPTSGAFGFHEDGCSVYLKSKLVEHGLGAIALVRNPATNVVLSIDVASVRGQKLGVARDPDPPESDGHLRNKAHALIVRTEETSSKSKLRNAARRLATAAHVVIEPSSSAWP